MSTFEDYLTQTIEKAVKEAVYEALKVVHKMIRRATTKEYLTSNKIMEFTGWSRRTENPCVAFLLVAYMGLREEDKG